MAIRFLDEEQGSSIRFLDDGGQDDTTTSSGDSGRTMVNNSKDVGIEKVGTFGKVFDVPSAVSRAAMRESNVAKFAGPFAGTLALSGILGKDVKKEAIKAAMFPSGVDTFQEEFVNKSIDEGQSTIKELFPESAIGVVVDMWSDPAGALIDVLTSGAGKALKAIKVAKAPTKAAGKITKAIKPTSSGKTSRALIGKFKDKLALATDTIIENADNITYFDEAGQTMGQGVPRNLDEFSSAIAQTKTKIFDEYSELAKQAGKGGATVSLDDIADELIKLSDNKVIKDFSPKLADDALKQADALLNRGFYSVDEADDVVKTLNNRLKSYYKTGVVAPGSSAEIDSLVRNQIASKLDDVINSSTKGSGTQSFQQLKNRYGALREIEPDVNRQVFAHMKKPVKTLSDLTDVFTASDIIAGVVSGSNVLITKGIVGQLIKGAQKVATDPNRAVRNAFSTMAKIKAGKVATPLGKTRIVGAVSPQIRRQGQN